MYNNINPKQIREENLIIYIDEINTSDRNKEMVKLYADGMAASELAKKFSVSNSRVTQILNAYVRKSHWHIRGTIGFF